MPAPVNREHTLHTAAVATATGPFLPVDGMGAVGLQVANSSGTFTITCEVNIDSVTWVAVPVILKTDNTVTAGGTISAAGLYLADVSGAHQFRARISAASGCSVTVKCVVYEGTVGFLDASTTLADLETHAGSIDTNVASALTALQTLDNIVSGSKALVTEDNSADIKTAVQVIDNFVSGSRGLVTEDNSASMLTALQVIDNFISGSRGLVTEDSAAGILTALTTPTGINGAPVTVGTTAVEMTFTGATKALSLMSDHDNAGKIWWGPSSVTSAGANAYGRLGPGQAVEIEVNDASAAIYTVSDTASQTVFKAALT